MHRRAIEDREDVPKPPPRIDGGGGGGGGGGGRKGRGTSAARLDRGGAETLGRKRIESRGSSALLGSSLSVSVSGLSLQLLRVTLTDQGFRYLRLPSLLGPLVIGTIFGRIFCVLEITQSLH